MDRPRLLRDIRHAEGFRNKPYKDSRGYWTAGYGHFLRQDYDWTGADPFPRETLEAWLSEDVEKAIAAARALHEWSALDTDARQNAVVELVFNLGPAKWEGFKRTRAALAARDWAAAKDELLNSAWAHEVQASRVDRIADYIYIGSFGKWDSISQASAA